MISIPFSKNWNNKLNCEYFTTIRLWNPNKYRIGTQAAIWLNEKPYANATVVDARKLKFEQINDWHSRLDAGMTASDLKGMFRKMYSKKIPEGSKMEDTEFVWLMLQRIK
jgi:hypothetical protein